MAQVLILCTAYDPCNVHAKVPILLEIEMETIETTCFFEDDAERGQEAQTATVV